MTVCKMESVQCLIKMYGVKAGAKDRQEENRDRMVVGMGVEGLAAEKSNLWRSGDAWRHSLDNFTES